MFNYNLRLKYDFGLINSFSCHNLNSVDPSSTILRFSESLERDLSNGVIKVYY